MSVGVTLVAVVAVVAVFDYRTAQEIALSFFYVIPIVLVTWAAGGRVGVSLAVVSAALFPAGDVLAGARPPGSLDELIFVADQLMYEAKDAGKNQLKSKKFAPPGVRESEATPHR